VTGTSLQGDTVTKTLDGLTLIVAIKQSCDGCRDFVNSTLDELNDVAVLILSDTDDTRGEWDNAVQPILVAPEALAALDIRWPPFYVLVDPAQRRVVTEGVVFGPTQVASEIEPYLSRPGCHTPPPEWKDVKGAR
jgi:hypothetical protein